MKVDDTGRQPDANGNNREGNLRDRFLRVSDDVKQIVEKRMELWMIRIGEQVTRIIAESLYRIIGVIFIAVGSLLLLFALAVFIGDLIGSESLGYLIVSAPFIILGLLFANRRPKSVISKTQHDMMDQFYSNIRQNLEKKRGEPASDATQSREKTKSD